MRSKRGQSGMSLMELLVALAVILILISTDPVLACGVDQSPEGTIVY